MNTRASKGLDTRCNIACNEAGVEASSTSANFAQQLHRVSTPPHAIARSVARNVASCVRSQPSFDKTT